uniref:Methyltransferase like 24 n=1 Tax=Acanthochromis polyacanthus TaxID=80966 RepID=A0A3Q1G816_9TELE
MRCYPTALFPFSGCTPPWIVQHSLTFGPSLGLPSISQTLLMTPRWHIDLQPWAGEGRSLEDEAKRFLSFITTPQEEAVQEGSTGDWAVCLDPKYSLIHRIQSKHCRVYSFGWVETNTHRHTTTRPASMSSADATDIQNICWLCHFQALRLLGSILIIFDHPCLVDVLKADMESAEWKILENLVLEGVLDSVGQLLLEIHLHWAGFEVGGDDPSVVRYWFSLLKELQHANFQLFHVHSDPNKPHLFLHKNVFNASSTYTLSWVNTQWKPSRNPK